MVIFAENAQKIILIPHEISVDGTMGIVVQLARIALAVSGIRHSVRYFV